MSEEVSFVTEIRGGWDEWSDERKVIVSIETPDGTLSPHGTVRVKRDGEEFEGDLEPVTPAGEVSGNKTRVKVSSWTPEFDSGPLTEDEFADAWGDWLFSPE